MRKLLVLAFAVAAATMAQASYLYWQTGTDADVNGHEVTGYNLYAVSELGSAQVANINIMDAEGDRVDSSPNGYAAGTTYVVDVSKYNDSYSFYVEVIGYDASVYGENTGVIGVSQAPTSYSDLVASGSIRPAGVALSIPTMWTGGPVSVPEPTSGLMMLLGMALLGLKRRKV